MEQDIPENCYECGDASIIVDWNLGQMVCTKCGCVVSDTVLDFQNESRVFEEDGPNQKARTDHVYNPLLEYEEKTSVADAAKKDRAIRNAAKRVEEKGGEKKMKEDLSMLYQICAIGNVHGVIQKGAIELYKEYITFTSNGKRDDIGKQRKTAVRQKDRECILAAAIFISCRKNNAPRTYQELTVFTRICKKDLCAMVRKMESSLNSARRSEVQSDESYISRFINRLNIPQAKYNEIASKMRELKSHLDGRKALPQSLAAVAIYAVCLLDEDLKNISIQDIALVTSIARPTIMKYHAYLR